MSLRGCLFAICLLAARTAMGDENIWVLRGRVLDQQGRPVAGAPVSTYWSANGITLEQIDKAQKDGREHPELSTHEGRMEPWGRDPTTSDAKGDFSIKMGWTNYFVLAYDKERKRGAITIVASSHPSRVDVRLQPLVRLRGTLRFPSTPKTPESTLVVARLPLNEDFPLGMDRIAICCSQQARFEFLLPPGKYEFEGAGELSGRRYELHPFPSTTLSAGRAVVDAGAFDLTPPPTTQADRIREARAKGTWAGIDHTRLFGQPAPRWYAADVRGIGKNTQISDLRGKWVLVYFWGLGCSSCLGKTLPTLARFYADHQTEREHFEIVSVCLVEPEIKTMADLDRELKLIVKSAWHGKPLPFPVVLDNTLKTMENFGVEAMGQKLLFDPAGRRVPGDEKTLDAKLAARRTNPAN